ncbi:YkgJ family cysteine cluster protein [uncultured Zoogloea sp.]|uniref:YkgJ family cysteine cluster protein n=1 Tax=uncultured Zoogloea sp. TaxID=160237 RepID=UPI00260BF464|nr:YkgJ family cysteine cluster protein [uncultured Zoogloea sp.]
MSIYFGCTACGKCCRGGPALSLDECLEHADRFVIGLNWRLQSLRLSADFTEKQVQQIKAHQEEIGFHTVRSGSFFAFVQVFPMVVDYASMHPTKPVCPMLDADTGRCSIYEVRPLMCRSVPFDPIVPPAVQRINVLQFGKAVGCASEIPGEGKALVFDGEQIVDNEYASAYARKLDVIKSDIPMLNRMVSFLSPHERVVGPSLDELHSASERNGWIETDLLALVAAYQFNKVDRSVWATLLEKQCSLIEKEIEGALQRKDKLERDRTLRLRATLSGYKRLLAK